MMNAIFLRGGRVALLLGGLVLSYMLVTVGRDDRFDYDPWAVD